uniref:Uncharacterized protein n=1 Tax=Anguilla anguilla TaxID=7936 RepID=A0A0E9WJ56_ANGAN
MWLTSHSKKKLTKAVIQKEHLNMSYLLHFVLLRFLECVKHMYNNNTLICYSLNNGFDF